MSGSSYRSYRRLVGVKQDQAAWFGWREERAIVQICVKAWTLEGHGSQDARGSGINWPVFQYQSEAGFIADPRELTK